MVLEVFKDVYKIEVPLPRNPLKIINTYLVKGDERDLLIDNGFSFDECERVLMSGLNELGVNLDKLDHFITHHHADHAGLLYRLFRKDSNIFISELEATLLKMSTRDELWLQLNKIAKRHGFPFDLNEGYRVIRKMVGTDDDCESRFRFVADQDEIRVGEFHFKCLFTPGHSIGHMSLLEENKKLLFSGDHIMAEITPSLQFWGNRGDPLEQYYDSLAKLKDLDISLVLPSHRRSLTDLKARVNELIAHHHERSQETLHAITVETGNAFEIASKLSWDVPGGWEELPPHQKWMATGETLSHLINLVNKGQAIINKEGETVKFSRQ